ncbi:outer membrane lipoprotein-sorting protein [bacterium]|nr:outer membrane lipoprotein-sorting protein [bacterium]
MCRYFLFSFFLIFNLIFSETISGYQLAKMVDDKNQPKSSKSEISMILINLKKDRTKTKEMISISKNDGEKMLLFFKTPKRDKGVGFLKIENDDNDKLSLFIPKLKKVRRISSNNQSDSFMGSDLSFEDMLSRNLGDFNYNILESDDESMYILESISKDEDSEYSRHISWISKDHLLIKEEDSYDQDGKLLKKKIFEQILIQGYHLVSKIDVTNVQDQHQTILEINNLEIDSNIQDDVFQEKNLQRFEKFSQ